VLCWLLWHVGFPRCGSTEVGCNPSRRGRADVVHDFVPAVLDDWLADRRAPDVGRALSTTHPAPPPLSGKPRSPSARQRIPGCDSGSSSGFGGVDDPLAARSDPRLPWRMQTELTSIFMTGQLFLVHVREDAARRFTFESRSLGNDSSSKVARGYSLGPARRLVIDALVVPLGGIRVAVRNLALMRGGGRSWAPFHPPHILPGECAGEGRKQRRMIPATRRPAIFASIRSTNYAARSASGRTRLRESRRPEGKWRGRRAADRRGAPARSDGASGPASGMVDREESVKIRKPAADTSAVRQRPQPASIDPRSRRAPSAPAR